MIISATLSKPVSTVQDILDHPYEKIKIKVENSSKGFSYYAEMFTKTQVFHKHFSEAELNGFIEKHAGKTFKNCTCRTETSEIIIMANKKGKITKIEKPLAKNNQNPDKADSRLKILPPPQKKKNYLIEEGNPVPFMVLLGIMNDEGKVISSKYDKFRQINRYLEFINDVLPELEKSKGDENENTDPIRIVDFGCGKSYLTFAVHYFLTEIKHIPCQIEGLDLKKEVIDYCNEMAEKLKLSNIIFHTGNIADYSGKADPDIIITLHACDTATDYALKYGVERKAKVILSVPSCQHQINTQLGQNKAAELSEDFAPLLKWGIIREKFSSLVTDALRGEWLEQQGYKVQMLEFIDMEHTPKNILIRAVKAKDSSKNGAVSSNMPSIVQTLNIRPEIFN